MVDDTALDEPKVEGDAQKSLCRDLPDVFLDHLQCIITGDSLLDDSSKESSHTHTRGHDVLGTGIADSFFNELFLFELEEGKYILPVY